MYLLMDQYQLASFAVLMPNIISLLYRLIKVTGYPLNNFMGSNFYWLQNQLSYVLC